jgi:hypothetical protein
MIGVGSHLQTSVIGGIGHRSPTWRAAAPDLLEWRQPIGPAQGVGDGGVHDVPHLILCTVMGHGFRATPAQ